MSAASIPDPLYDQAVAVVRLYQRASISFLQSRLCIRYHRAAVLLERMEVEGFISVMAPNGARTVAAVDPTAPIPAPCAAPYVPDATAVMRQALTVLREVLDLADAPLAGANLKCGDWPAPACFSEPIACCGAPVDTVGRVKAAIAALQTELGERP